MTGGEWAAVVVSIAVAILVAGLLVAFVSLIRTLRTLRVSVEELRRETLPLVADLRTAVGQANTELDRVDGLLGTAESLTATLDSASRLAYLAFSNPLVKAMALGAGTARAARRLRRRDGQS